MKNIKLIIAGILFIFIPFGLMSQDDIPPNPPGSHGTDADADPGSGAPIGSGIVILLTLGAAYGTKKLYSLNKKVKEE